MFDTTLIKQRITCVEVAQHLGLPIRQSGDRCVSPLRPGATNASSFCVDDDFWYDFGDARGGDCIDLMAEVRFDGDKGAAIRELASMTGVSDSNPRPDGWKQYTQNMCNMIAHWQTQLTPEDYDYLHSRGLTDDTITQLRIGRTDNGRLSIPYLKNGYVAYYVTRHLPGGAFPESKYRKQKRDDFNEHIPWGLETLSRPGDTLIIAEGAFDAISFYQEQYPVLSAITGFFSKSQLPTVLAAARKFSRVFIVYDDDSSTSNAGAKFTLRMSELLTKHRIPFVVGTVPTPYHDISEYYAAGGDLSRIITAAEPGLSYVASRFSEFSELEKFIYTASRYTKRTVLDELFTQLRQSGRWNEKSLTSLYKSCTTAPPENIVADEILTSKQLIYVDNVGFYEYLHGVWTRQPDGIIKSYADQTYGEFSTSNRINAICNLLKTRALQDVTFDRAPVWNFINGTLELDTGLFRDHNPSDYCSVQASYPYNPDATYHAWSKFIDDVTGSDPKTSELLQFIPGYALMSHNNFEKIFVLTGSGGNGKSRYLEILRQLFGEANVSHVTPRGLLDKFQRILLKDSIINLAGEIKSDLQDAEEYMKQIASGEPQSACYKTKDYVTFIPRSKLVFACNGQLASGDTSDGLARRLIIIDFKMRFVDDPNPGDPYERPKDIHILEKLSHEVNSGGVFNWAYEGYKLLKTVGYFTETTDQVELLNEFSRESNPVLVFYEETILPNRPAELSNTQLYSDYKTWCEANGYRPRASNSFHREFKNVSRMVYQPFRTNSARGYKLLCRF